MSRWVVHAREVFTARHALARYLGRQEEPHEHRWQIEIRVGSERLNDEGYALDFHAVRRILADAVHPLAGTYLNCHPEIGRPTPSAERVAEVLAGQISDPLRAIGGELLSISVWEGPENRVDLHLDQTS